MDGGGKLFDEITNISIQNSTLITQWCLDFPKISETRIYKMKSGKILLVSKSKSNVSC